MGQSVMQEAWFAIFKVKFTVRAHIITVSTIPTELLIFLLPNVNGWYIVISWSVLFKDWIVVFKVKVTVKVQNFIESLCILYPLCH